MDDERRFEKTYFYQKDRQRIAKLREQADATE